MCKVLLFLGILIEKLRKYSEIILVKILCHIIIVCKYAHY